MPHKSKIINEFIIQSTNTKQLDVKKKLAF